MDISLTTPALLFPAISLLLVAYTNRFLALGSRIRSLHSLYKNDPEISISDQIRILKKRVFLIRNMQLCGVAALFCCVLSMFCLFAEKIWMGKLIFGVSLLLMLVSLGFSLRELFISVEALKIELKDMQEIEG
ncbi:MAG: DUF2721 domain-containing protein [Desulfobulbaceae bacterium]|nr:DUF2721 domain-containing protein [Desulfobulbaceae bacterium]